MPVGCRLLFSRPLVVLLLLAAAGCSITQLRPGTLIADQSEKTNSSSDTVLALAGQSFFTELSTCRTKTSGDPCAGSLWGKGRAFLDLACSRFLDAIGNAAQDSAFLRKETTLAGGLVAGALALAEKSATTVGTSALAFTFAEASQDVWATTYLFAPGSNSVSRLVARAEAAYSSGATSIVNGDKFSYEQAIELLVGYEELCRPARIRGFVDEAITKAEIQLDDTSALTDIEVQTLIAEVSAALKRPVTEEDVIELFVWYGGAGKPNAKVAIDLKEKGLIDNGRKPEEIRNDLARPFAKLMLANSPIRKRWQGAVAQLVETKTKALAETQDVRSKILLSITPPKR